jgi:putative nucleotidyltransferase with HDIG domain
MSAPSLIEVLHRRIHDFLVFLKSRLIALEADLDRLAQLRRLSDVRIRQFAVGKPKITAADLCAHLADPKTGRFDALARETGLAREDHLAQALPPLGEEMGLVTECCLSLQVVGLERMKALLHEFVTKSGPPPGAPSGSPATPPSSPAQAPFPPAVAKLLGHIKELWSIPAQTLKILEMLQVPETPAASISNEIEKDPGLSAQCLRVVNSAQFGLGTRIASIKRAIVTLGYQMTRRIVSISALTTRLGRPHAELEFDLKAFWRHSLWVGHAASMVARSTKLGDADEHFAAGLIHDIGKLVEYQFLRGPMKLVLEAVRAGAPYEEAEAKVLGVTHPVIGACLCERWRFPALVVAAVRHHRDPVSVLEDVQLPREALVVAALCHLAGESPPAEEVRSWAGFVRLSPEKIALVRDEASRLTAGSLTEFFTTP